MKKIIAVIVLTALISGCASWDNMSKTQKGAVIGAGSGALIGTAVSRDAKGALIGGAAGAVGGGVIGHQMDKKDEAGE